MEITKEQFIENNIDFSEIEKNLSNVFGNIKDDFLVADAIRSIYFKNITNINFNNTIFYLDLRIEVSKIKNNMAIISFELFSTPDLDQNKMLKYFYMNNKLKSTIFKHKRNCDLETIKNSLPQALTNFYNNISKYEEYF